ncbi:MAG: SGNH/GDSL hydrolase family protein [Candidatus Obscuribacter sp.]|nr:SGNH/GDSL hydrolase family protein [Candidatus Obscuribacter sp.]
MSVKIVVASPGDTDNKTMKSSSELLEKSSDGAPMGQIAAESDAGSTKAGTAQQNSSRPGVAKRVLSRTLSSTTLITAVLLGSLYCGLFKAFDWKDLAAQDSSKWIVAKAAIAPQYIYSPESKNIVILGSSLIMAPSENLNDLDGVAIGNPGSETAAPRGLIYVDGLKKATGLSLSTKVLGVPGALTSDQTLITNELIAGGKAPQLLVLTYAPRDFMSNDIGDDIDFTPTARVFHFASLDHGFLPTSFDPQIMRKCFDSHTGFIDSVRRFYLRAIREKTCQFTNHPYSLFESMQKETQTKPTTPLAVTAIAAPVAAPIAAPVAAPVGAPDAATITAPIDGQKQSPADIAKARHEEVLKKDLELYRTRYWPINEKKIKTQMAQLEKLMASASKAQLPVVLVGMPLSAKNIEVLGEANRLRLENQIKEMATRYQIEVIDFNDLPDKLKFAQDEFIDSVHLNKPGSTRFVSLFSTTLAQTKAFGRAFNKQ